MKMCTHILLLMAVLIAMPAQATYFNNCTKETVCSSGMAPVSMRGESRALWLVWRGAADRAAVALLQQVLAARGFCRLALCEAPQGLCKLLEKPPDNFNTALVAGFEATSSLECRSARVLDVVGEQSAPLPLRLHVVLSSEAANNSVCAAAASYSEGKLTTSADLPAYVPHEWQVNEENKAEIRRLLGNKLFKRIDCTRAELTARIKDRNDTFVFVDAELWDEEPHVQVVRNASAAGAAPVMLCSEKVHLMIHAPILLRTLRKFAPRSRHLREIIALEPEPSEGLTLGEAASRAALVWATNNEAEFNETCVALQPRSEEYRVMVYRCAEDRAAWAHNRFKKLMYAISLNLRGVTQPRLIVMTIQTIVEYINCLDHEELRTYVQRLMGEEGSHRMLGVVAAGAGVEAAARLATQEGVALVTYDAQPPLTGSSYASLISAGARTADLARALRRVLEACNWRRVVLLSEETPAAAAVAAQFGEVGSVRKAVLPRDNATLLDTLRALRSADARVFAVNAGAEGAARALAAGAALGLTEEAGCAWVVREWTWGLAPPVRLLALRSEARVPGEEGAGRVHELWGSQDWPQRAAPLAEAILTLGLSYARLLERPSLRFDHRTNETLILLRSSLVQGPPLEGIGQYLVFDEQGAIPPPILLEVYEAGNASGALYNPGDAAACPAPPLSDGTVNCTLFTGDGFAPSTCLDLPVLLGAFLLLLAMLFAAYGAAAWRQKERERKKKRERQLRDDACTELLARQRGIVSVLAEWHVERKRLRMLSELGAGRHGRVWLAALATEETRGSIAYQYVAAKEPHPSCSPAEESELLREAATLAGLRHEHVVRLIGVSVAGGPPVVLTEQAFFGDLQRYLVSRRALAADAEGEAAHVSAEALTRLAREAALAMAYLAARKVVHCDVRAANCLVDERRSLKLADFGMARELGTGEGARDDEYACRRRKLVPVRWMPPESLSRGVFSPASDVWALGVLALELVTLGQRPFGALDSPAVVALVKAGGCARLPAACSREFRWLVQACWRSEPEERPTARDVAEWLAQRPRALEPVPQDLAYDGDDDSGFGEAPAASNGNQFYTTDSTTQKISTAVMT